MAKIPESADISEDKRDAELIFSAHLAEVDPPVFDGQAAAIAVVAQLHNLILQSLVLEIVTDSGNKIEPLASFTAVAD